MNKKFLRTLLCATALITSIFTLSSCSKQETNNTITPTSTATEQAIHDSALEVTEQATPEPTPNVTEQPRRKPTPEVTATPIPTEEPRMTFSHKDEYTTDLYNLIISLPEEKPASTLKQKDVDCDTLQWFNATYAMFTYHSGADYHLVGGYSDEANTVDSYVLDGLEQSWGITDRASAIESIAWLAYEGHATEYNDILQMMYEIGMLDGNESDLRKFMAAISEEEGWTKEKHMEILDYYLEMRNLYNKCGENGIDAWDYCRIMQITGNCYYAGYLTLEECLTIQLATAKVIQDEFDSWEAMNTSYLYGYSYWTYGSDAFDYRLWAYQTLQNKPDCPFTVLDFDMKLEKFW